MKASVVIATYNRRNDLDRCLASILKQEGCEYDVLVVDDASPDDTVEFVEAKYGDRVRMITMPANHGSIHNRNFGAREADGEILFLLDDDIEFVGTDTLKEVLEEFSAPEVGAIGIPYFEHGELKHGSPGEERDSPRYVSASYVGCCSAVRRNLFVEVGGYEVFFHHAVEEDDLCLRLLEKGYFTILGKVSNPIIHYESPRRNFFRWDFYGRRNTLLHVYKNCPGIYLLPNLAMTSFNGLRHAFRIKRFSGNLHGLLNGWVNIFVAPLRKKIERNPVRREVYALARKLRHGCLPLDECRDALK